MRSVLNIFVKSPFIPLEEHAQKGIQAAIKLEEMMDAYFKGTPEFETLCQEIDTLEHEADMIKQKFRSELPASIVLQIDTGDLLNFLKSQDSIADSAQDAAYWMTLRDGTKTPEDVKKGFEKLMKKNVECVQAYKNVLLRLEPIHATSYSSTEMNTLLELVPIVESLEHDVDVLETSLLKTIFDNENNLGEAGVYHLSQLVRHIGEIADKSASSADILRRMFLQLL